MWSGKKYSIVIAVLMICVMSVPAAAQLADTPWPMFHHDSNHTGLSQYHGPDTPAIKWNFSTGNRITGSAVIGEDGTIYVGTRNYQKANTGSKLYAIYPNGTEKWQRAASHFIDSTPAVASDGTIYMGSWDKCLYAIYPNGTKRWEFCTPCGGFVVTSPAIAPDGTIYVGSNDKKLYALYPNGTEKWNYCTGQSVQSSPAIGSDGIIYVGSCDKKLYAIYPNGTLKWLYATGGSVISSPAIDSDGTVYVGSKDGNLYAIYPNGTLKWLYATGGSVISSPAIDSDGTVYVGSKDGNLYAFYSNGTLKWIYGTGGEVESSPTIDGDGTVYVGSKDGSVYAINPNNTLLWSYNTGNQIFYSSPAIASDGTVYIGNWGGNLYAFGPGIQSNIVSLLDPVGDKTVNESETVTIDLNASDPDGDSLTYSCNRTDLFTNFDPSTGAGSWTTVHTDSGTYWVNFGVSDGNGGIDNETIRIDVLDSNRPPVLEQVGDRTINETETVAIDLNASDPDGDSLTYSCNRTDLFTNFDPSTGAGSWTTVHTDSGTYWVNFGVSDGNGGIDNETIRIDVLDSNRPPVLEQVGDRTINETETVAIDLNASDPDGDSLTYSCNRTDLFTNFDPSTGAGSWTTVHTDSGTYWVNFGVSDGNGGIDNETIRIDVLDSNRPPVLDAIGDQTINETETVAIDLNASDPDGDSLTYSCNRTDLFTNFDPSTGAGSWTTVHTDSGTYWVNFGVSDGNGGIDNETIRIDVLDSNRPPVLDAIGDQTINETETVAIDLNASDPDGDSLTYSCNRTDLFTNFDPSTGAGSWTTVHTDSGTYWVNFGVSDGNGGIDNETIRIDVLDSNRPPVLEQVGDRTINETETVAIDLNASDPDGDSLTYSCNRTDLFTNFDPSTGTGSWTTVHTDSGTYWVNFGVSDGNGGIDNETIRIDVLDSNRPPVLDAIGDQTINETETVAIDLNASDPDGDSLTYSCNRTDLFSDFDPSTGTGSWTTVHTDSGTYWVDFGVSDGNGGIDNETIQITVKGASVEISVLPADTFVQPQDQFDVKIYVDTNGLDVYAVQYNLTYNTSVVRAETQNKDTFLGQISETMVIVNEIDQPYGVVSYAETRKVSGEVNESDNVTNIHFIAIGVRGATTNLTLYDVVISDEDGIPIDYVIKNGAVKITVNTPPVPIGVTKHRTNNVAQKYQSTAVLCSCSYDPDYGNKGGNITYIRWAFGDGQYGTTEGLPVDNCTCKEHRYESWQWAPIGNSSGAYVPFDVQLEVTDDGCPELTNNSTFTINVYIAGDANGDGEVNILDAVWVGKNWRETCPADLGNPLPPDCCGDCEGYLWNDEQTDGADLNNDCEINILDAVIVGANWRHTAW